MSSPSLDEKLPANGWQNMGRILQWLFESQHTLTAMEQSVYLFIVRSNAGYCKTTTNSLAYNYIAKTAGVSVRTVSNVMPSLIEKKFIIKVATNNAHNAGKVGYAYQLNYKLDNFPSINTGQDSKPKSKIDIQQSLIEELGVDAVMKMKRK